MILSFSFHIHGDFENDLQVIVQPIGQWLAMNKESNNPVISQSTRLDVPAAL